jgi:hypothetical protein
MLGIVMRRHSWGIAGAAARGKALMAVTTARAGIGCMPAGTAADPERSMANPDVSTTHFVYPQVDVRRFPETSILDLGRQGGVAALPARFAAVMVRAR